MKKSKEMVTITIDLDQDLLLTLALEAHRRNMKLNDFVVELLEKSIKERENVKA